MLGIAAFSAILLWAVFLFKGRGVHSTKGFPCVQTAEHENEKEIQNKTNLAVQIGIDGSESMLGFVNDEISQYITTIQKLDDLLRPSNLKTDLGSSVENINVKYFRLGVNVRRQVTEKQLLGKDEGTSFLDAKFPSFYCYGPTKKYPCVSSSLHQILIDHVAESAPEAVTAPSNILPNSKKLRSAESPSPTIRNDTMQILITDLEPDNNAIGEITDRISNIFDQHPNYKAILLGIPSEFNGTLYSADQPKTITKSYQSREISEQDGRPFYLFVIGPSPMVQTFVERFSDRVGKDMAKTIRTSAFHRQPSPILLNINSKFGEKNEDCTYRKYSLKGKQLTAEQESDWLILGQDKCQDKHKDIKLDDVYSRPSWLLRGGKFSANSFTISEPSLVTVTEVSLNSDDDIPYLDLSLEISGEKSSNDEQPIYITLNEKNLDEIIWQDWSTPINNLDGRKTQQLMDFVKSVRGKVSQGHDALRFCLGYVKT